MFLCSWFWRAVGVSLFWGLFWLVRRVFSGSGFFWFLGLLAFLRFGRGGWGVGLLGVFSGSGLGAPGSSPSSCWGWVGCVWRVRLLRFCAGVGCVRAWFLTSLCFGGWGLGVFVRLVHSWDAVSGGGLGGPAPVFCAGVGCAWFPVSCSRWFFVVFAEGFPGVFVSARRFLPLVWGVSGWVGVCFSGCSARSGFGLVP